MSTDRRILVLGHSPYGRERARQLLRDAGGVEIVEAEGRLPVRTALRAVLRRRARTVYLVDVGNSTVVSALAARVRRRRVVVDTGDAAYALARSTGGRSFLGLVTVRVGEQLVLRCAHHVVVRGHAHVALLPSARATVIPDVAPEGVERRDGRGVRDRHGLGDSFVVGLVGSIVHAPRLGVAYGWDLIEALPLTDGSVRALIVGDGTGREGLERRARALGVHDRCCFVGRVSGAEVASYIGAMDVAISTQSNDVAGAVRTTGKLPLYLAAGCPVLASHVGEAARVIGPLGWTLPYDGVVDPGYPRRLAAAIECRRVDPTWRTDARELAAEAAAVHFDASEMRARLRAVLNDGHRSRTAHWRR
jgi:glycosyltransferase involved in cell wall biosynthesis